jgi:hypothetical protein
MKWGECSQYLAMLDVDKAPPDGVALRRDGRRTGLRRTGERQHA